MVAVVPALNEKRHIASCLEAPDAQVGARFDHLVLFANNCSDATVNIARAMRLVSGLELHVVEETLPPYLKCGGIPMDSSGEDLRVGPKVARWEGWRRRSVGGSPSRTNILDDRLEPAGGRVRA